MSNQTAKKPAQESAQSESKIVTRYDRKVQKRKEEARRAARNKKITLVTSVVILAAIIIGSIAGIITNYTKVHKEYIVVDNDSISQIEFDFYYAIAKSEMLNTTLYGTMTYGDYFTSYLGYDTSKADSKQQYSSSDDYTWYDYFANMAVSTIKEYKALLKAADDAGFTYDAADSDYTEFTDNISSSAESEGISVKKYYKEVFGSHSSEKNLKSFVQEYLKAAAYSEQLQTDLAATDSEISEYYEENKDSYDLVNYRAYEIQADTGEENSITMDEARVKAEAVAAATSEEEFAQLALQYAEDDDKDNYTDVDATLVSGASKSYLDTEIGEWLYDSTRAAGDVTYIEDTDNSKITVLYFISREYNSTSETTIASTILSNKYQELISGYTDNMEVVNKHNRIKMLSE
jgi:hypothetical protein